MSYLIDTNIVIYYFNGLTADEALHNLLKESFKVGCRNSPIIEPI